MRTIHLLLCTGLSRCFVYSHSSRGNSSSPVHSPSGACLSVPAWAFTLCDDDVYHSRSNYGDTSIPTIAFPAFLFLCFFSLFSCLPIIVQYMRISVAFITSAIATLQYRLRDARLLKMCLFPLSHNGGGGRTGTPSRDLHFLVRAFYKWPHVHT